MTKFLLRTFTLLLVPCLVGDALIPTDAATFWRQEAVLIANPALFQTEAFAEYLPNFVNSLFKRRKISEAMEVRTVSGGLDAPSSEPPPVPAAAAPHIYQILHRRLFDERYTSIVYTGMWHGNTYYVKVARDPWLGQREQKVLAELAGHSELAAYLPPDLRANTLTRDDAYLLNLLDSDAHLEIGSPYLMARQMPGLSVTQSWNRLQKSQLPLKSLEKEVLNQLLAIVEAMEALHSAGIAHRDLGPDEIFINAANGNGIHVGLIDFALATTPRYPEASLIHENRDYRGTYREMYTQPGMEGFERDWRALQELMAQYGHRLPSGSMAGKALIAFDDIPVPSLQHMKEFIRGLKAPLSNGGPSGLGQTTIAGGFNAPSLDLPFEQRAANFFVPPILRDRLLYLNSGDHASWANSGEAPSAAPQTMARDVSFVEWLEQHKSDFAENHSIALSISEESTVPLMTFNQEMMISLFLNLTKNAAQANAEHVLIEVMPVEDDASKVRILLQDDGKGMSYPQLMSMQDALYIKSGFKQFSAAAEKILGFPQKRGLQVVRQTIEALSGEIDVQSRLQLKGKREFVTSILITLPIGNPSPFNAFGIARTSEAKSEAMAHYREAYEMFVAAWDRISVLRSAKPVILGIAGALARGDARWGLFPAEMDFKMAKDAIDQERLKHSSPSPKGNGRRFPSDLDIQLNEEFERPGRIFDHYSLLVREIFRKTRVLVDAGVFLATPVVSIDHVIPADPALRRAA